MATASGEVPPPSCFRREWAEADGAAAVAHDRPAARLRALSLNILADGLCAGGAQGASPGPDRPALFAAGGRAGGVARLEEGAAGAGMQFTFRAPDEAVCWSHRWTLLLAMILEHDPDIIGLQEVDMLEGDRKHKTPAHDKEIKRDLASAGYDGVLARKYGRACDGVAVFWRRSRLRPEGSCKGLSLGSVHVALLQPLILDDCWELAAVATHLKAGLSKDAEDMRRKQGASLLQQLKGRADVLLLADLNAHCRPWLDDAGRLVEPQAHPLLASALWSAYEAVLGEEPDFTSWGGWADRDVRGVFDYIFTRGALLAPVRALRPPASDDVLAVPERMPNAGHPTDHVPMVVDFLINATSSEPPPASKRRRQ